MFKNWSNLRKEKSVKTILSFQDEKKEETSAYKSPLTLKFVLVQGRPHPVSPNTSIYDVPMVLYISISQIPVIHL